MWAVWGGDGDGSGSPVSRAVPATTGRVYNNHNNHTHRGEMMVKLCATTAAVARLRSQGCDFSFMFFFSFTVSHDNQSVVTVFYSKSQVTKAELSTL